MSALIDISAPRLAAEIVERLQGVFPALKVKSEGSLIAVVDGSDDWEALELTWPFDNGYEGDDAWIAGILSALTLAQDHAGIDSALSPVCSVEGDQITLGYGDAPVPSIDLPAIPLSAVSGSDS